MIRNSQTDVAGAPRAAHNGRLVLTINGGSSSIRFAIYPFGEPIQNLLSGKIERIGLADSLFKASGSDNKPEERLSIAAPDHQAAMDFLMPWLEQRVGLHALAAVGHRVVHGGRHHTAPQRVTAKMLDELRRVSPYDPEHMPAALRLIELVQKRLPNLPQVACFDTAFHRDLPRVARLLPIPRRFDSQGIQRYGFHGLSYAFVMQELSRVAGQEAANGRVVLAHLGNGASLAAVHGGKSIDTSMAFTPTAGVPMSTRSGDLDPGLVWYLARAEQMTPEQFHHMVNHQSGLLGVSEISPDMRDLLAKERDDIRAAEAVALFCYQVKKWIGAFAAALGGLDALVFSGGIGENAPVIRARICEGLAFLGLHLDAMANTNNAPVISTGASPVTARVIRTNEELMIAKAVFQELA